MPISADAFSYNGMQMEAHNDSITSPLFGIVIKPTQYVAIFASRTEGLTAIPEHDQHGGDFCVRTSRIGRRRQAVI